MSNCILDIKNRDQIYKLIIKSPGIHIRKISKELRLSNSTIIYHLNCLQKNELIVEKKENGYSHFFCSKTKKGNDETKLIQAIRQKTRLQIILFLLVSFCSSNLEISKNLEKDYKTVTFHLKKLEEMGIIQRVESSKDFLNTNLKKSSFMKCTRSSRELFYNLNDPYLTFKVIDENINKLSEDSISTEILAFFKSLFPEEKPRIVKSTKMNDATDRVFKIFFEFFPFPCVA